VKLSTFGRPQLIVLTPLIAISAGYLVSQTPSESDISNIMVFTGMLVAILAFGGILSIELTDVTIGTNPLGRTYFNGGMITECHTRMSGKEQSWMELLDRPKDAEYCSNNIIEVLRKLDWL
jgi:hypothetical protein